MIRVFLFLFLPMSMVMNSWMRYTWITNRPVNEWAAARSGMSSPLSKGSTVRWLTIPFSETALIIFSTSLTGQCNDPFTTISRKTRLNASKRYPDSGKPRTTQTPLGWRRCRDQSLAGTSSVQTTAPCNPTPSVNSSIFLMASGLLKLMTTSGLRWAGTSHASFKPMPRLSIATTRKPRALANWMASTPRPPIPTIATDFPFSNPISLIAFHTVA